MSIESIETVSREDATKKIADFLEPSAARLVRAEEYYREWNEKRSVETVDGAVEEVILSDDRATAIVRYTSVIRSEDGTLSTVPQRTQWRLIDGIWYRNLVSADMRSNN